MTKSKMTYDYHKNHTHIHTAHPRAHNSIYIFALMAYKFKFLLEWNRCRRHRHEDCFAFGKMKRNWEWQVESVRVCVCRYYALVKNKYRPGCLLSSTKWRQTFVSTHRIYSSRIHAHIFRVCACVCVRAVHTIQHAFIFIYCCSPFK